MKNYITEATRNRILATVEDACENSEAWTCGESVDYIMFRAWDSSAQDAFNSLPCDIRMTMGEIIDHAKEEIVAAATEVGFGIFPSVNVGDPDGYGWRGEKFGMPFDDCHDDWDALERLADALLPQRVHDALKAAVA